MPLRYGMCFTWSREVAMMWKCCKVMYHLLSNLMHVIILSRCFFQKCQSSRHSCIWQLFFFYVLWHEEKSGKSTLWWTLISSQCKKHDQRQSHKREIRGTQNVPFAPPVERNKLWNCPTRAGRRHTNIILKNKKNDNVYISLIIC